MDADALIDQLVIDEAMKLKLYDDATGKELLPGDVLRGKLSGGIGHNFSDDGLTVAEARELCFSDIASHVADLDQHLPWWRQMSEDRQQVLANLCFNIGITRLLGFHNALQAMQTGDYDRAATEMLNSTWAKEVGDRAVRLATRMRGLAA